MNTLKEVYLNHTGISATITVIVMMGLLRFLRMIPLSYEMSYIVAECIVAVIITFILYQINGNGKFLFSTKGLGYSFKLAWWPLLLLLGLSLLTIAAFILYDGKSVSGNPFLIVIGAVLLAIFVGYFEEGLFRGIVLNAFLVKSGGTFKGILMSCIYSSIIFGFVHVYSDSLSLFINPSTFSVSVLLQIIGKTISTGMFGFILAVIFLRTHNLFNVAIMHAINDLGPFLSAFLFNEQNLTQYVETDAAQANVFPIEYAAQIVLMLPAIIYAYKQLKKVSVPQWGMFKETWYPLSVRKSKQDN